MTTSTKPARDIKTGDMILWHGIRMKVTHSRKSRYSGYQAIQMQRVDDADQRIIAHDVHVSDQIVLATA